MSTLAVAAATVLQAVVATTPANAVQADPGAGFTVTAGDLTYLLKQIKIAERHSATLTAGNPCGTLVGPNANQIPDRLTAYGLRTVDGSCNNLFAGREKFAAADQPFPRYTSPTFKAAEDSIFGTGATSYAQKTGDVFDSKPRTVSNLIVDQTSTNPAAVAAAQFPVRTQGSGGIVACTTDPDPVAGTAGVPAGCVPSHQTLFIPNVTTDVGLSPPYNSMFTFFGQFFDHGVDQTVKSGANVYVPLKADDPLRTLGPDGRAGTGDEVPANQAFMVLTRAQNQPGADGILGTGDDVQNADNTDSPWVDQSQTYTSHASHQALLREYDMVAGLPVANGRLLGGIVNDDTCPADTNTTPCYNDGNATDGSISTWASTKKQAALKLGLLLKDKDVTNIPMLATDPYGEFIPAANGLPQYVCKTTDNGCGADLLLPGDLASPVAVPDNAQHFNTPFLTDIAHNADPSPQDADHNPATPPVAPVPDANTTASADFASQAPGTYDDEMLNDHFTCGDGRCNENIALSTIHQVFHSEHDRLVADIENTLNKPANAALNTAFHNTNTGAALDDPTRTFGYGDRLFQAARFVTEMEYQHLVFEEFGRKVQPLIRPFHVYSPDINPAIHAEFAHAVYRFGHSMLDDDVARTGPDGTDNSLPLLTAFLNPPEYFNNGAGGTYTPQEAAGAVVMGSSDQTGNELDEFVTETLRNNLLGLPLDLPAINMTRAREAGVPPLNDVRRQLYAETNDGQLAPYGSWAEFGQHLKHPESLINFVAAYGKHPSITGVDTLAAKRAAAKAIVDPSSGVQTDPADIPADSADFMFGQGAWANDPDTDVTTTGLDDVDLWVGGLAEVTNLFGGLLGSTFNYVFQNQMEDLQDGDRLYYLNRTPGMNLRTQLEGNSFSEMIQRNTDGTNTLKADVFGTADCKFQLGHLTSPYDPAQPTISQAATPPLAPLTGSGTINDDPTTADCDENQLLVKLANGTIQYRARNNIDPTGINGQSVYNGTTGDDRVAGGNDNDTFWGGQGVDRIQGQGGDDVALGGPGNDILTDLDGADVSKGGDGNDAIDGGPGDDIPMGGDGQDFINGGANDNETFAGPGNDFVIAGLGADAVFGDSGDDWIQGGSGQDLLIGDHSAPFFDDPSQDSGHDVFVGQVGENDYDAEGGDDIMSQNAAVDRNAGSGGWDWAIHQYDTVGGDDDMAINNFLVGAPIQVVVNRDRWQETEADSGSAFNDVIRGTNDVPRTVGGGGFTGCDVLDQAGLDRVAGLDALVPALTGDASDVAALSAAGVCPLTGPVWGDGDILLGGGGSDTLEGRAADDVIDGDKALQVRISYRSDVNDPATEISSTDLMEHKALTGATFGPNTTNKTLQKAVFDGDIDAGKLAVVREIVDPAASDAASIDTAVFSGPRGSYNITTGGGHVTVTDTTGTDGVDQLSHMERLQFTDGTINAPAPPTAPTIGTALAGDGSALVQWTAGPGTGAEATTEYKIQVISAGVVQRTVGGIAPTATSTTVTGLTNATSYTFRVIATNGVGDSTPSAASNAVTPVNSPPSVLVANPANGSSGFAIGANLTATFSEPVVNVSSTTALLRRTSDGVGVGKVVTYNAATRTVTVNPNANLAASTSYTLTLVGTGAGGIQGATGLHLATTRIVFTTAGDTTAPTVTSSTPVNGAVGVGENSNLVVNFSERIQGVSDTSVVLTNRATGTVIPATLTLSAAGNRLTVNPTPTLARNTAYDLKLLGGAARLRDVVGNPLSDTTIGFTIR